MSEFDDKIKEMFSKPSCACLHEIENNLPRTIFCFIPCRAQHDILRKREVDAWWNGLDESEKNKFSIQYYNTTTPTEDEIELMWVKERLKTNLKNKK